MKGESELFDYLVEEHSRKNTQSLQREYAWYYMVSSK